MLIRNSDEITRRLDAVSEAKSNLALTKAVRETLKSVHDLERLGSRIVMGHSSGRDLVALKRSIQMLPDIINAAAEFKSPMFSAVISGAADVDSLYTLADLIERAIREDAPPTINEGGLIKKGYNQELDDLIRISRDGKGWLAELEIREKAATDINSLKVRYNKVFGYYIEVPKARSAAVPPHYVRKQTLVNAERYITDELKKFESQVLGAEE